MDEQPKLTPKQIKIYLVNLAVMALRDTQLSLTSEEALDVEYEKRKFRKYIMEYLKTKKETNNV